MDNAQFHGVVLAIQNVVNGGFWKGALHRQLICVMPHSYSSSCNRRLTASFNFMYPPPFFLCDTYYRSKGSLIGPCSCNNAGFYVMIQLVWEGGLFVEMHFFGATMTVRHRSTEAAGGAAKAGRGVPSHPLCHLAGTAAGQAGGIQHPGLLWHDLSGRAGSFAAALGHLPTQRMDAASGRLCAYLHHP